MTRAEALGGMRRDPAAANVALLGATIAVSFSAIFIRIAGDDPATIVWVRMAIAATLLLPWVRAGLRTRSLTLARPQIALVAVSGVLLAGHFLLWTASLQYTSIAASVLLVSLHPVMVSPLGWRMLGERTGARAVGGIGVAIIGTAITCAGDFRLSGEALGGDLLALGGAACLAGYLVIGRGVRYSIGVAPYSAAVYAVVAIVAAVTAVTQRTAHLPSARVAVLCLALAVVCTLGGHTVYNWALRRTQALKVSVAFLGEPPLAALLAAVCFGAIPPASTVIGGVLILAGIALTLRYQ